MNMKWKLIIFTLIFFLLLTNIPQTAEASVSVSARNAILMEQESGRVLFEKSAHEKRRIASITKIMTAILAIESGKLEDMVTISERAEGTEGSSLFLKKNEKVKLEDLVYGLMLRSGNDAAVAIAEHVGGSLEGFVFLMNEKAREIGMANSHFANPHGLDDSDSHYSTAYDMAILTRYAMENDTYKKISGTEVHHAPNPTEKWDRVWRNKNRLLTGLYDYSTGGKTGYTKLAKRTLVSTAMKDNMNLIAVTLNGPDDWNDHIGMFEMAFKKYEMVKVIEAGIIAEIDEDFYKQKVYFEHDYRYPVTSEEKEKFQVDMKLQTPKQEWEEARNIPTVVGKATITFDNKMIKELPIYYEIDDSEQLSLFERFKNLFTAMIGVNNNG
ncbi:D-alanyl-D-alanine carboxypeptidase DacB [Robertmurraya siralis]|uniref:serine-type D-Ala-D-Ala carboxypeptidase n=2 Tax=Robertmurraya siralis TaxID=77777 RepID=A0A919WF67_9BACI|nr:D-alanyl-D-alanine carboxypeptidase family protein [Robertmurraya siralis]PAE22038.1 D-alanyl-D-alanine carboxypeptidase [Bacillus sp. 7504-2]GIN60684.1 D-alanyl-D-alanine carboxypeptidase DacB [Robertmurraya siralis]